ncbi:unnamed protein product, partial [Rotaria sp. Silwood1]
MEMLVPLASMTPPRPLALRSIAVIGPTCSGKSSIINALCGREVAPVGIDKTTKYIKSYKEKHFCIYDTPGFGDLDTNFTKENISLWKGLTVRIVLITTSITEVIQIFHLFDAIGLNYDIVVNKFDLVEPNARETFKVYIKNEILTYDLKRVKNVWYVSALKPTQFPDWQKMIFYLHGDQVGPYHTVAKIYPDVEMWFEEMTNTRNRKFAAIVLLPNRTPSQVEEFIRTNIHNHRGVDVCFVISDDGNLYDTQWCTTFSPEMRWSRSIDDRWCDNVQAACCTASDLYINHYQKQEMRSRDENNEANTRWFRLQQCNRAVIQTQYNQLLSNSS